MAWRPNEYLIEGELDNSTPEKVTGWMQFIGMNKKVVFDLKGDFHRDIRGAKIHFKGNSTGKKPNAKAYMNGFARQQTGKVGDMTAGRPPQDYVDYPYFEWYSNENGRVVLELEQSQVEIIGTPLPSLVCESISRKEQNCNMSEFLQDIARQFSGGA